MSKYLFYTILLLLFTNSAEARTEKYRCMWREDPATTMVVGWHQVSGSNAVLYYDTQDWGQDAYGYNRSQKADRTVKAKGMNNHFVRLTGLIPNTEYYFVIKDSDGTSQRMSFKTAPDSPYERLSIISGGDSRNFREARQSANMMVAKLRPHCVTFGGDMTGGDIEQQWRAWFEDWQLTITKEGHLTPIIVARGNHEAANQSLVDLFDVKAKDLYYALTLGGNLLRIYTLNSMIPTGGSQKDWLHRDLSTNRNMIWKMGQYHHSIRPHNSKKSEQNDQLMDWATAFHKYNVNLVVESDVHTVKTTYPIRPSKDAGSDEGFIRDDRSGTVYIGEGCWGAPLRQNNDTKAWTRASGSFNQFKWIFIDQNKIEIRTIKTDGSDRVASVSPYNVFSIPNGINIWNPPTGDVITIEKPGAKLAPSYTINNPNTSTPSTSSNIAATVKDITASRNAGDVIVRWTTQNENTNATFEIQRSTDGGKVYQPIGQVNGKGRGSHNYSYTDQDFAANNAGAFVKYRVKQVQDASSQFSNTTDTRIAGSAIRNAKVHELRANPVDQTIRAKYDLSVYGNVTLHLIDPSSMRELERVSYPDQRPGQYEKTLNLSAAPSGKYTLVIKINGRMIKRFTVSK
ncbi:MAG: fibronectin type III domain-containing protein [Saprospiraceae bacterium]